MEEEDAAGGGGGGGCTMGGYGWGGGDGDGRRGGAEEEGEGISASSISLFDVRPAPNSAVRATLSKWLGGHQRKCLGTTLPPFSFAFLQNPTGIPYYTATAG